MPPVASALEWWKWKISNFTVKKSGQHHTPPNMILWEHVSFGGIAAKIDLLVRQLETSSNWRTRPVFQNCQGRVSCTSRPHRWERSRLPSLCSRACMPWAPSIRARVWLVPRMLLGKDFSWLRYVQKCLRTLVHSWANHMWPKREEAITWSLGS